MVEQDPWLSELRKKQAKEEAVRLEEAKKKAAEIGKKPFDALELEKYWTSPNYKHLTKEQIEECMQLVERDYYLAGERFLTMEDYGKHLMEMELYS